MRPLAKTTGVQAEQTSTGWRFTTSDGAIHEVPAVTAAIWRAANGQAELTELLAAARAVEPAADAALVWSALDALADAGLVSRTAPPAAGLDRRAAIRTLAAAAGAMLAVLPRGARSADEADKGAVKNQEQADKLSLKSQEQADKLSLKSQEQADKLQRTDEEAAKAEIVTVEARAKEEEAKLSPEVRADPVAGRKREELAKGEVSKIRAREENKKKTMKSEQKVKVQ